MMRFSRAVSVALAGVGTVSAFRPTGMAIRQYYGRPETHFFRTESPQVAAGWSSCRRQTATVPLSMVFERFFGGGANALRIDYSKLDRPGSELGALARQGKLPPAQTDDGLDVATFAGGCFWGLELAYQRVVGVQYTAVGYTQGKEEEPNYNQVCSGATGHAEAVIVYYHPLECSYEILLDTFFERVNPTTVKGQGGDYGMQYRTGVYVHTQQQEEAARDRFAKEQTRYQNSIATELKSAQVFWPAEKYHQQYLEKGGRFGSPQDASKGATEEIRCYG